MRFTIAILLGVFMFQASPIPLSPPRENDVRTSWNYENTNSDENAFNRARQKRSIGGASGKSDAPTNSRDVLISHRYGYFLQVTEDGKVSGTKNRSSNNLQFRMEKYGTSIVRLFNKEYKCYIAVNERGVVITERIKTSNSLFHEVFMFPSYYVRFSLAKYETDKWLLSLKKNGKVKNARTTNPKMKATYFFIL